MDLRTLRHEPGVTLLAVLRTPVERGAAGLFAPVLKLAGVSLGAVDGKLAVRSVSEGNLPDRRRGTTRRSTIVALTLPMAPDKARLYANGELLAESRGIDPVLTGPSNWGGSPDAWPAEVGELMVFTGILSHRDRQLAERVLAGKWQGGGALAADSDGDGLPDWWEWEAVTGPGTDDAGLDADHDGVVNRDAFLQGRSGFVWKDEDGDGMHDGWESTHSLDPRVNDADLDLDCDGFVNSIEHALGTDPRPASTQKRPGGFSRQGIRRPRGLKSASGQTTIRGRLGLRSKNRTPCCPEVGASCAPMIRRPRPKMGSPDRQWKFSPAANAASAARFFRLRLLDE